MGDHIQILLLKTYPHPDRFPSPSEINTPCAFHIAAGDPVNPITARQLRESRASYLFPQSNIRKLFQYVLDFNGEIAVYFNWSFYQDPVTVFEVLELLEKSGNPAFKDLTLRYLTYMRGQLRDYDPDENPYGNRYTAYKRFLKRAMIQYPLIDEEIKRQILIPGEISLEPLFNDHYFFILVDGGRLKADSDKLQLLKTIFLSMNVPLPVRWVDNINPRYGNTFFPHHANDPGIVDLRTHPEL
ncbi:MAG: hypothetical protein JW774_08815 [Candidatus Aureabacteria bacterium]|nr:hypothetical protein [Candidatus Auribacterota bacterium]